MPIVALCCRSVARKGALASLLALSCSPAAPAETPSPSAPPPAEQPPPEPPTVEASPLDDNDPQEREESWANDPPEASQEQSTPDPGPENALALCQSVCSKMKGACSERAADFCYASCGDYESAATKCPVEVEAALGCQASADDFLLCSNIAAPSCAPLFTRMKDCRAGSVPPQARSEEREPEDRGPAGFARLLVPGLEISQLLPESASLSRDSAGLNRASAELNGVEYSLVQLPDEPHAPTDKSILRTAIGFVGNDCQPKLRLHGRFEKQGVIHVRLDTVCKDGSEHHGMLHFFDGHVVATDLTFGAGESPPASDVVDAFLFSFEKE